MVIMLENILFNEIPVRNLKKAIDWYKEVLRLEFVWESEEEKLAQLNLPSGQMLFLVETADETKANFTVNGKQHNVIGFQTKEIEKLYAHLQQQHVKVEAIEDDGVGNQFLHFYDPDGNLFNVQCDKGMAI